jgi:cysteine desulfurase
VNGAIYLDGNADAPVLPEAWQAYREASVDYGNPSSRHAVGRAARHRLADARQQIASTLGVAADEVVFTSGGTESNALALRGVLDAQARRPHGVTTTIEHAAVARLLDASEARGEAAVTRVAPDRSGRVDAEEVLAALGPQTCLVSVVAACNETGVLQPIQEIARGARGKGVVTHTDGVQALQWLGSDLADLSIDLIAGSGHKLGAVGGIGLLLVGARVGLEPIVVGGGQELGRRASTENVAGAASLAAAFARLPDAEERAAVARRRDALERGLADACGEVEVIGGRVERLPNTSCLRLPGCAGDGVMMALDQNGVQISTGSACASGSVEPSPILLGMGLDREQAKETVRFSLTRQTTDAEIASAVEATVSVVRRMRQLSSRVYT